MNMAYRDVLLHIDGAWIPSATRNTLEVINPATEDLLGTVAHAGSADLDQALAAAARGFEIWRNLSPYERSKFLRKAAEILRERAEAIAILLVQEQGKPLAQARLEPLGAADIIEWFAEEGRRAYGRAIPAQLSLREPVGVVAAFSPWNFPINQAVRKIAAALAAGCSIILKGPEETPGSCAELVRAFADAGLPPGVVNLVFGVPADISNYLIAHPVVRKISFTGSTAVGKQLASLAGTHMKRATMELGGHAPAIVFADAPVDVVAKLLSTAKYRNAGQICIAPTRMLVQDEIYESFVEIFTAGAETLKLGNGLDNGTTMGPLAHARRVTAMEAFIADAEQKGARIRTGGKRHGNKGYFFEPTVLTDLPPDARLMHEEPFGPIALIAPFSSMAEVIAEANRLPYGLAAYAYTRSASTAATIAAALESGMISINHQGLSLPETPFGGVKDSGYGSEGGAEGLEPYLVTKFITQASL